MLLGNGVVFKYILRTPANQAVNSIEAGKVERDGTGGLRVRDERGALVEELSGAKIRSWCIVAADGVLIDGDMVPGDYDRLCDSRFRDDSIVRLPLAGHQQPSIAEEKAPDKERPRPTHRCASLVGSRLYESHDQQMT
jgi:hypothetical protein